MTRSQKVLMTSIKAITLNSDQKTSYRRTSSLPQLTCKGSECRRFQPDVVQCTAVGEDGLGGLEWKCEADLPDGVRFGAVEMSCEGWDGPDDPYVLRGSCGLTYNLVRTSPALESQTYNPFSSYKKESRTGPASARQGGANRPNGWWPGGGGGGGGGGPGGYGGGPPPPYSAKPDASTESAWRPGFWSGLAAGAVGAALSNRGGGGGYGYGNRYEDQRRFERYRDDIDRGVGGSGSWGLGRAGSGGGMRSRDSSSSSGGTMRASTGFGGTRNR